MYLAGDNFICSGGKNCNISSPSSSEHFELVLKTHSFHKGMTKKSLRKAFPFAAGKTKMRGLRRAPEAAALPLQCGVPL